MILNKDAEFLCLLMEEFYGKKHIINRLKFFNSYEEEDRIKGWETWWQIEFAYFIDSHKKVAKGDWHRECSYEIDQRKALAINEGKTKAFLDFAFRQKGSNKEEFIGVELKHARDFHHCITQMVDDFIKIDSIKIKEDDLRSIWCVGLFLQYPKEVPDSKTLEEIIIEKMNQRAGYEIDEKDIYISKIKNTQYTMVCF